MEKFLIKDKNTGKGSITTTMFVIGFTTATLKLLISGLTFAGYQMSPFTGVDYAAAVAALGGVYSLRKRQTIKPDKAPQKEE